MACVVPHVHVLLPGDCQAPELRVARQTGAAPPREGAGVPLLCSLMLFSLQNTFGMYDLPIYMITCAMSRRPFLPT